MRRLCLQDIADAARHVARAPAAQQEAIVRQWCAEAHMADKLCKRCGRAHPRFGTGSLSSRVGTLPPVSCHGGMEADLAALSAVLRACQRWRADQKGVGKYPQSL